MAAEEGTVEIERALTAFDNFRRYNLGDPWLLTVGLILVVNNPSD